MRFAILSTLFSVVFTSFGVAQEATTFGSDADDKKSQTRWTPTHPDGDTPHERMLTLAHTDALPQFDRCELFAVSVPKPPSRARPKREPNDKTFPIRPYGVYADVHAQKLVTGDACEELRQAWQSLSFDALGGAFCHYPAYGVRMYRNEALLFETTICWECQNFYVPRYDADQRRYTYGWYGFAKDENSESLLRLLQKILPHPQL